MDFTSSSSCSSLIEDNCYLGCRWIITCLHKYWSAGRCSDSLHHRAAGRPHLLSRFHIDWGLKTTASLNMETAAFTCWLLLLLFSPAVPMCFPTDFTLYVERPECDYCVAINTTICVGFCYSRDSNIRTVVGPRFLVQTGCAYDKLEYRAAILPGCPISSNPVFTYPVALSCHCGACRTDSNECAHRAGVGGARCTKPVRRVYPYPGQSTYLTPL